MHSTDESSPLPEKKARWKKCPICWDTVYISDIRPVGWYRGQTDTPTEGGDVVLRLVMRHPRSTLALPRDGVEKTLGLDDDIPWYHVAEVPDYARIMKGGEDYMISQYDNEIQDLLRQAQEDELLFGDDSTWTRKAVAAIREAKEKVKDIGNPPIPPRQPPERRPTRIPIKFEQPPDGVPEMYKIRHATKPGQTLPNNVHTPSNPPTTARNTFPNHDQLDDVSVAISKLEVNQTLEMQNQRTHSNLSAQSKTAGKARDASGAPHPPDHPFYFYQALPHFYLSSLDIRILKAAFGDYSQFPSTILPRIERISTGHIVDEDLRKRTKYLGHLPYGCEVSFLECDWRDLVGSDVLQQFSGDIERRRKRNREKAAQEEKERIRAEKNEEEQRWASARRKRPSVSAADRPFSENDFQPLGFEASSSAPGFDPTMSSASPPWSSSRGRNRPSFTALASPSGSPPDSSATTTAGPTLHRTVWGTAAIAPTSPQATYRNPDREPNDGWLQDWERELMVEQEHKILAATTNIDSNGPGNSTNATGTGTTGGKKKKNKKITLMSTTARRAA